MNRCFICKKWYQPGREMTCSDGCHEALLAKMVAEFGEFKRVISKRTGKSYRVPTRDILDPGIREQNLAQYPIWQE